MTRWNELPETLDTIGTHYSNMQLKNASSLKIREENLPLHHKVNDTKKEWEMVEWIKNNENYRRKSERSDKRKVRFLVFEDLRCTVVDEASANFVGGLRWETS